LLIVSGFQQGTVTVTQKTELVTKGVIIDFFPFITSQKCGNQKQKRTVWLVKIGQQSINNVEFIAWGYQ